MWTWSWRGRSNRSRHRRTHPSSVYAAAPLVPPLLKADFDHPQSSSTKPREQSPSSTRKVRHAHTPRPRPSARTSSSSVLARHSPAEQQPAYDPFSSINVPRPLPQFLPLSPDGSPARPGVAPLAIEGDDEEDAAADAEMDAFASRLRDLIESGRDALASRPTFLESPTRSLLEEDRALPLPVSAPALSGTAGGRRHSAIPRFEGSARRTPTRREGPMVTSPTMQSHIPVARDALASLQEGGGTRGHGRRESASGALQSQTLTAIPRLAGSRLAHPVTPDSPLAGSDDARAKRHASRSSWGGESSAQHKEELEGMLSRASNKGAVGWWERKD